MKLSATIPTTLKHFLEIDADAIFTLDDKGRISYANFRAAACAGLTAEEAVGCHLENELSHLLSHRWYTASRQVLALGSPMEYEVFHRILGGWTCVRIVPTPDGLAVRFRDCNEEKWMAASQCISSALLEVYTADQVLAVLLKDVVECTGAYSGTLHVLNKGSMLDLHSQKGQTPKLFEHRRLIPLSLDIPPCAAVREVKSIFISDDEFDLQDPESLALRSEQVHSLASLPVSVGEITWGVLTLTFEELRRFPDSEQAFLRSLVKQCTQAFTRVRAESNLQHSQHRLSFILETAGIGYWEREATDDMTFCCTPEFDIIFGHTPGSVLWTYEIYMEHVVAEDRETVDQNYRNILTDQQPWDTEFRIRRPDGEVRWIWGFGYTLHKAGSSEVHLLGLVQDITERKQAQEKLQVQSDTLATLHRIGQALAAELDMSKLSQAVTDASVELSGAQYAAFFAPTHKHQESHTLYALSGTAREAFAAYPLPRTTAVLRPTFDKEGVVRTDDITQDERYGHNLPYHGVPPGHLPVRSYMAVPVVTRAGDVLGGLLLGHEKVGVFTDQAEQLIVGLAAQTAIALDNAQLCKQLQQSNTELESHIQERTRLLHEQALKLYRRNADLEQCAYVVSHDLQVRIRSVTRLARHIDKKYKAALDDQSKGYLKCIINSGEYMKKLVDDLLTFSQACRKE